MQSCGSCLQRGKALKCTYISKRTQTLANIYSQCTHIIPMCSPHLHTHTAIASCSRNGSCFDTQLLTKLVNLSRDKEHSVMPAPLAYPKQRIHKRTCTQVVWYTVHPLLFVSLHFLKMLKLGVKVQSSDSEYENEKKGCNEWCSKITTTCELYILLQLMYNLSWPTIFCTNTSVYILQSC